MSNVLQTRLTSRFVGTYKHLDDWNTVGSYEVLETRTKIVDEADVCEPARTTMLVVLKCDDPNESPALIRKALFDTFTHDGCHHEHDCCGCRSFRVTHVKQLRRPHKGGQTWRVNVFSSRNY